MTTQALKALKESIAHWTRLATGKRITDEDIYDDDCALCAKFYCGKEDEHCKGCPVAAKTGVPGCSGTPHHAVIEAQDDFGDDSPQFRTAAKKELAFLKSLLSKKGKG